MNVKVKVDTNFIKMRILTISVKMVIQSRNEEGDSTARRPSKNAITTISIAIMVRILPNNKYVPTVYESMPPKSHTKATSLTVWRGIRLVFFF